MRSAAYSILTSVLLLAPISAVPLMAIFGVPQFTPVVASPLDESDEDADDWDHTPRKPTRSKSVEDRASTEEIDPFDDESLDWDEPRKDRLKPVKKARTRTRDASDDEELAEAPSSDRRPATKSTPIAPTGRPERPAALLDDADDEVEFASSESSDDTPSGVGNAAFEREVNQPQNTESIPSPDAIPGYRRTRTGTVPERPNDPTPGRFRRSTPSGSPLTWSKAVTRLNELGIRNFKLEPGVRPGEFTFTCSYTPTNSPHVTRRFEAEADDPLKAVSQVLSQVERWAQQKESPASKRTAQSPRELE